jgi:uroporphyrin-III C-methyltransferase
VRSDARIIEVGKRGGCTSTPQAFIEKLLILYAKEKKNVVRLKGGDPFVFGRGGEEVEALRAQGIDVEIIPGITAGTAVPASLGIPVTHRGVASAFLVVSGHAAEAYAPVLQSVPIWAEWESIGRSGGWAVFAVAAGTHCAANYYNVPTKHDPR